MSKRDFLSILDLTPEEISHVVHRAVQLSEGQPSSALAGKSVALLFEKPSLRTKASFMVGIHQMGGYPFYMGPDEVGLGVREAISDVAKVLCRYVDCIVARVFSHEHLVELAQHSSVPVVNALSDWEHPCQALADLQTMYQHKGSLEGLGIAFIGDGNNVARSLGLGAAAVGSSFTIACPEGYDLDSKTLARAGGLASKAAVSCVRKPVDSVTGADVVYTDVWTSMGQEKDALERTKAFSGYTVDADLLSHAKPGAIFMHDLPAHYGEEVAEGMLDHPQSVVFNQAENRLHAQKALLELVLS